MPIEEPRESAIISAKPEPIDAVPIDLTPTKSKPRRKRSGGTPDLRRIRPEEVAAACVAAPAHALLMRLLFATGARLSEVVGRDGLTVQAIDFASATARLRTLKRRGEHHRVVPLPATILGQLAQRIAAEHLGPDARLFPFTRQYAHGVIRKALLSVGVDAHRARPHALRHGHAFHAIGGGVPITVVQKMLGHSSPLTTAIYLSATAADVRAAYSKVEF